MSLDPLETDPPAAMRPGQGPAGRGLAEGRPETVLALGIEQNAVLFLCLTHVGHLLFPYVNPPATGLVVVGPPRPRATAARREALR